MSSRVTSLSGLLKRMPTRTSSNHSITPAPPFVACLLKPPPRCSLVEFLFNEPEPHARPKAIHWLRHLSYIPRVFLLIRCRELLKLCVPRVDHFHCAFEDHCLDRVIRADYAFGVPGQI